MGAAAPLAAIAAPFIAGAFTKRPKSPSYQYTGPDRSHYIDQLLESGFNPQSELYNIATERANEDITRRLAMMGMGGSSLGQQAQAMTQAALANKFLEGEMGRRQAALETARGFDALTAGADAQRYQSDLAKYQSQVEGNQNLISGIAGLAGTGLGYLGQSQIADQMNLNRQMMRDYLFPKAAPVPFGGGPSMSSGVYMGTPYTSNIS